MNEFFYNLQWDETVPPGHRGNIPSELFTHYQLSVGDTIEIPWWVDTISTPQPRPVRIEKIRQRFTFTGPSQRQERQRAELADCPILLVVPR